eukprot:CAMPEP_0117465560 /NCGR_PEP_ID=MMETSP0784-20121206/4691_1 /TAXON_ID=39447 /ORGANISM="" /LENGTH=1839 /DNA_ID=CAMNT_0005259477 /DNA_START=64 /DNA_END=5583 /DNA_ORIENTATION=+
MVADRAVPSAPSAGISELVQEILDRHVKRVQENLTQELRSFEVGVSVYMQKGVGGELETSPAETVRLQVIQLEQQRRRRRQESHTLRRVLSQVRQALSDETTPVSEQGDLAASQLLSEIRSQRECWFVEKRMLEEQIRKIESIIEEHRNDNVPEVDLEKESLRRTLKQLQLSIESRDRYACWVCNQQAVRATWGDEDEEGVAIENALSESDGHGEIAAMQDRIAEMQKELRQLRDVSFSNKVTTEPVSPIGHRTSRGRTSTPYFSDDVLRDASEDEQGTRPVVHLAGEPARVEEVEIAPESQLRKSRDRLPTPFVSPETLTLHAENDQAKSVQFVDESDARASMVNGDAAAAPGQVVRLAGEPASVHEFEVEGRESQMRSSRGRTPTPMIAQDTLHRVDDAVRLAPVVTFVDEPAATVEETTQQAADAETRQMRSCRERVATPFVDGNAVTVDAAQLSALPIKRPPIGNVHFNEGASRSEVPASLASDMKSIRGRVPTKFVSGDDAPPISPTVQFDTRNSIGSAASDASDGPAKSVRTRVPTKFVSPEDQKFPEGGVQFNASPDVSTVSASAAGKLKSSRGRVPTKFASQDEVRNVGLAVQFDDRFSIGGAASKEATKPKSVRRRVPTRYASEPPRGVKFKVQDDVSEVNAAAGGNLKSTRNRVPTAFVHNVGDVAVPCVSAESLKNEPQASMPDMVARAHNIRFASDDSVISPVVAGPGAELNSVEMKSTRGRVPTAFVTPSAQDRRIIRFTEDELVAQGARPIPWSCESTSMGSDVQDPSDFPPSGGLSRASSSSVRSKSASSIGEESEAPSETGSRSARSRVCTPFISATNFGFTVENSGLGSGSITVEGRSDGRRLDSDGLSIEISMDKVRNSTQCTSDTTRQHSSLVKQASIESFAEREITERVKRSMQRLVYSERKPIWKKYDNGALTNQQFHPKGWARVRKLLHVGRVRDRPRSQSFGEISPEADIEDRLVVDAPKDVQLLKEALGNLDIFDDLDQESLMSLIDVLQVYQYQDMDYAVRQGDLEGSHFFVAAEGEFGVFKDGKALGTITPGMCFGETALLLFGERCATVRAIGPAKAYAIEGQAVREMLRMRYEKKHEATTSAIDDVLASNTIEMFSKLNAFQLQSLYDRTMLQKFNDGEVLLEEGDNCVESMFVVLSGTLSLHANGMELQRLGRFALIGDLAMIFQEVPTTAVAEGDVEVLVLPRVLLGDIFGRQLPQVLVKSRILGFLCRHEIFARLHDEQRDAVASCCEVVTLEPNEELSGPDIRFVAVLYGQVSTSPIPQPDCDSVETSPTSPGSRASLRRYSGNRKECFGEANLRQRSMPWSDRVRAAGHSHVTLAVWRGADLDSILTFDDLDFALEQEDKVRILAKVFIFRTLSKGQLLDLADVVQVHRLRAGEAIFEQGDIGTDFYIVRTGLVVIEKDKRKIRTQGPGDYFGERALLNEKADYRSATVSTLEDTEVWKIGKEALQGVMNGPILDYLKARISLQDTQITFKDLQFVRVIGRGGFGIVKMVQAVKTKVRYALKCVRKKDIVDKGQQESLRSELNILAEVDHPFVIKFVRSFNGPAFVYFLTELVSGGELLEALDVMGLLKYGQAQFYTASIVLALEFLHARRIAYLDLKSENCLLDHQGYLKIIDFGIAQRITGGRCLAVKGTPMFMSPEMILVKGYNTTADLWSLGVCVYEFVIGQFPFGSNCTNMGEIWQDVVKGNLVFPSWYDKVQHSKETMDFISGLLTRDPVKRLGGGPGGFSAIYDHPFFGGFNFDDLLGRKLTPPIVPQEETYAEDHGSGNQRRSSGEKLRPLEEEEEEASAEAGVPTGEEGPSGWDADF